MILKPLRLTPGDTIAVIAPAGPVIPSEILPAKERLEALGFHVVLGNSLYENRSYLAGSDQARLKDLLDAFRDTTVKAILCARGGYGALRLLPEIDLDLIRANPKILVGYSDITALLLCLSGRTGLVSFHGPMARDLLKNQGNNLQYLLGLLSGTSPNGDQMRGVRVLKPGKCRGRLVGGNLSLLCHMAGTPYMPKWRQCVLFLEDKGEASYRIDRMLTHLRLSGFLKGIAGLAAGEFAECGEPLQIDELLLDAVGDLDIPVVSGFPFGHGEENLTLPLGMPAVLDTDRLTLTWAGSPVK